MSEIEIVRAEEKKRGGIAWKCYTDSKKVFYKLLVS